MNYDPRKFKHHERESYNAVAPAWSEDVAGRTAAYGEALLDGLAPAPGCELLDLACGSGHLAEAAMRRFRCRATCADLSEGMLQQAGLRAPDARLERCDAEHLPFGDASFDIVASGLGLMYFPDTAKALGQIRRVLRPGGRCGFVVWAAADKTACLRIAMSAVAESAAPGPAKWFLRLPGLGEAFFFMATQDVIPGRGPSPFRFSREGRLAGALLDAGFRGARVWEHSTRWDYSDFDSFWRLFVRSTPMQSEPFSEETVREIRRRMEIKAAAYRTGSGYSFPMTALLATATR